MVGEGVVAHPAEARVSTGIPSLDAMLEGGLVAHRPYLIVGPSGTGKTTLATQFLCEGVRRNERVLLVTLEEPPNEARANHRGLEPTLGRVEVFDAIPDIMRYERAPFKDIASVRTAVPFDHVSFRIRRSPELASVEVTITALEQMLRTEVIRKGYTRLVIDSLTALQYFCMKGFDPVGGAQSLLRFLSDLRVTTLITVEAPLEDVETPERMLARGEIRLFRWELEGRTVRAIGVEKFRGSSHDVRLHPYRIGPQGIDINLEVTISRDTRQIIEPIVPRIAVPVAAAPVAPFASPVTPLIDEVRDLILIGADVAPARSEIAAALAATIDGRPDQTQAHLSRVSSLIVGIVDQLSRSTGLSTDPSAQAALQRVLVRADSVRAGVPPTSLPPASALQVQLGALLSLLPPPAPALPPIPTLPVEEAPPSPVTAAPRPPSMVPAVSPSPPAPAEPVPSPEPVREPAPSVAAEPSKPEVPVPPVPMAVAPGPAPVVEPPVVPAPPVAPAPTPAPVSAEPPPATAPLPVEEVPATPPPEPPAPARIARKLPPPPKPHPPVSGLRPVKAAPAPASRPGGTKAGPPPLPSTAVPEWPSAPSPSARSAGAAHPSARAAEARPVVRPGAERAAVPSGGKKRRKAAAAPATKRSAAHGRAPAAREPEVRAHSPPPPPVPTLAVSAALPAEPGAPSEPASAPKARRRTPRKRKAPPVVSATVEPIPPGALGEPFADAKPADDPDRPREPGG